MCIEIPKLDEGYIEKVTTLLRKFFEVNSNDEHRIGRPYTDKTSLIEKDDVIFIYYTTYNNNKIIWELFTILEEIETCYIAMKENHFMIGTTLHNNWRDVYNDLYDQLDQIQKNKPVG